MRRALCLLFALGLFARGVYLLYAELFHQHSPDAGGRINGKIFVVACSMAGIGALLAMG